MSSYSKRRGVNTDGGRGKMSTDEKRRQWNVDLAKRTISNMFTDIQIDDDVVVQNKYRKRVNYTPDTLLEKAREYFENIIEANENEVTIIPDIEDFCLFAHISRNKFIKYRRSDDEEMAEIANNIATAIAGCKKQNAYAGLINPIAFAMDMNNNHDYVQSRTETTINSNISLQQVETNIEDIASRIPVEDIPLIEGNIIEEAVVENETNEEGVEKNE